MGKALACRIELGDCLERLRALPDCSVDSIVTDPPYGLGTRQPGLADLQAYLAGGNLDTGGDFMARDWSIPPISVWVECLRVLRPGGHLVAFAGSRTQDLIALGIRCAGFEIRDGLTWLHGQGFPKSLNVGKAIDKSAGAERPVVGTRVGLPGYSLAPAKVSGERYAARGDSLKECSVTAPATPEAAAWEGWGTALKPAFEPIILARKALDGTVAACVLEHGTGALNIDGCRIATDWAEPDRPESWKASGHSADPGAASMLGTGGTGIQCHPAGRWPANVILSHLDGCQIVGWREVDRMTHGEVDPAATDQSIFGCGRRTTGTTPERIPVWSCAPGCMVAELDNQSGIGQASASTAPRGSRPGSWFQTGGDKGDGKPCGPTWGDYGGASRYFLQVQPDAPFFYTGKASTAERDAGLGGRDGRKVTDGRDTPIDNPYQRGETVRRNTHVSVKPLALMRWLVRLVTPPGGLVVDPFAGSGTTIAAAALEGFRAVGFEREPEYVEIARARVKHWTRKHRPGVRVPATPQALKPDTSAGPVMDPRQATLFTGWDAE